MTSQRDKFGSSISSSDKVGELKDVLQGKKEVPQKPADEKLQQDQQLADDLKDMEQKLQKAEEEAKSNHDKLVRTLAEYENFRKRMQREKEEVTKYASEKLVQEFLPVLDHLEMTLDHAPNKEDPLVQGVELTVKQFIQTLEKQGIQIIKGEGLPFNPHFHEAMGEEVSDTIKPGNIIKIHRKGFMIHDRVIRPALVTIASEEEKTVH